MNETTNHFRVVLRGYDPAQVDRRMSELGEAAGEAQHQLEQLTARAMQLEDERDSALEQASWSEPGEPEPPTYTHLGERVGQILCLAEEEGEEIRSRARGELDAERESFATEVARVRAEADRYAANRRGDADTDAARVIEDARRIADERLDSADRDAAARLQEAEAVYEDQRARAAKAAADFETTLATRRKAAEEEFTQRMGETQRSLDEAQRLLEKARAEADATTADATRESRRIVSEAEQQAAQVVHDAKTTAARVRSDSERELAAAVQRRDSINAQLANVRQMLATLTGGAVELPADPFDGEAADVPAPVAVVVDEAAAVVDEAAAVADAAVADEAPAEVEETAGAQEQEEWTLEPAR